MIARLVALTLSGVAIGGAGYLTLVHLRDVLHGDYEAGAYASARVGFIIIVYLLAKLVIHLHELPLTGDVGWYLLGLTLSGAGYGYLAVRALLGYRKGRKA